mgnify:CR=1 FL=1
MSYLEQNIKLAKQYAHVDLTKTLTEYYNVMQHMKPVGFDKWRGKICSHCNNKSISNTGVDCQCDTVRRIIFNDLYNKGTYIPMHPKNMDIQSQESSIWSEIQELSTDVEQSYDMSSDQLLEDLKEQEEEKLEVVEDVTKEIYLWD